MSSLMLDNLLLVTSEVHLPNLASILFPHCTLYQDLNPLPDVPLTIIATLELVNQMVILGESPFAINSIKTCIYDYSQGTICTQSG